MEPSVGFILSVWFMGYRKKSPCCLDFRFVAEVVVGVVGAVGFVMVSLSCKNLLNASHRKCMECERAEAAALHEDLASWQRCLEGLFIAWMNGFVL